MIFEIFVIVIASSNQFETFIKTTSVTFFDITFEIIFKIIFVKKQFIDLIRKRHLMQLRYNLIKKKIITFRDFQNAFRTFTFLTYFNRK